jgi:hypothetical protein
MARPTARVWSEMNPTTLIIISANLTMAGSTAVPICSASSWSWTERIFCFPAVVSAAFEAAPLYLSVRSW